MTDQNETTTPDTENTFVCDCHEYARSACKDEQFFKEHEGKRYCVIHYPDTDKLEEFRVALNRKLRKQDLDFRGGWFPERVNFENFELSADVSFDSATFSADVSFKSAKFRAGADFDNATFSAGVSFDDAKFSANVSFISASFKSYVSFDSATFSADVSFKSAKFRADADFSSATFSANVSFTQTTFSAYVSFDSATFKSYVSFALSTTKKTSGKKLWLDLQFTHIEKPERVSFHGHTLDLKPRWFINCDSRKFEFTDCNWNFNLKQDLEGSQHRLLAIAYRQLADNAEANHRYHEASRFRYNAFEARRIEKFRGFVPWKLEWWYWLASGYGESVDRAFVVFVTLFALFAFGYGRVGFDQNSKATTNVAQTTAASPSTPDTVGKPLGWKEAAVYSFNVSILQKPEPKPLTLAAKILVSLETVLGPAQAALLALAVRRRFMR